MIIHSINQYLLIFIYIQTGHFSDRFMKPKELNLMFSRAILDKKTQEYNLFCSLCPFSVSSVYIFLCNEPILNVAYNTNNAIVHLIRNSYKVTLISLKNALCELPNGIQMNKLILHVGELAVFPYQ